MASRDTVISLFGPAAESGNEKLNYEFRLKGDPENAPTAMLDLGYRLDEQNPDSIQASFTHYKVKIDVSSGKLTVKYVL